VLAIHLLHEASKGSLSFWYPYLRSLPRSYTTAMCFTDSEAAALQAAHAMAAARAAAAAAAAAHAGARPALRALRLEPKWRRLGAWLWAASTLSSRTMYLPFDSAGALTPFGDLHNYRPPPPPFTPALPDLLRGAAALAGAADGAAASIGAGSTAAAVAAGAAATERRLPRVAAAAVDAAAVSTQAEEGIAGDGRLDEDAGEYCIHARIR
jgi:histone-lysine N-methyltransferase SETD3